jgi:hypothetical protein
MLFSIISQPQQKLPRRWEGFILSERIVLFDLGA